MHITKKSLSDTKVKLTMQADQALLEAAKHEALEAMAATMKVQGFRAGKAPLTLVEKQADQTRLRAEFLDTALNHLYAAALEQEKLRPVDRPEAHITKFVPFDTLEVEATVEVIGEVKLADYRKLKLKKDDVKITAKDIDDVLANLRSREAAKQDVDRAAASGDEVVIDFAGHDAKTKQPIKGADGKDYPLQLGSNSFIPGFEKHLEGVKPGAETTFTLTFPKDYGLAALQNRKVEFTVTVKTVRALALPTIDDVFAAKVGPFKTVTELKDDIKAQLQAEKQHQADQSFTDRLITEVTAKSKIALPEILVTEQLERQERERRQSLLYRGQTWQEYLEAEGLTEEQWRERERPTAEQRVKAGIVLAEVADKEEVTVTPQELDAQLAALKANYPDPQMQAELAKPEARRDIASRMLTEKTLKKLTAYVEK